MDNYPEGISRFNPPWDDDSDILAVDKRKLTEECKAYLESKESDMDSVEEGDDGVFYYQVCDNNAENCWEVELPERFNSLFQ